MNLPTTCLSFHVPSSCDNFTAPPAHLSPFLPKILESRELGLDLFIGALVSLLVYLLFTQTRWISKGVRFPPGPPGQAIFGNVSDMPKKHEWLTYTRWAKEYGDLVYIKVLNQPIVFVNSAAVALDLFDRRASLYNDRFDFPMLGDLMGFNWNFVLLRYGDKWRRHRRTFHQKFHPTAATAYYPIQTKHAHDLVRRFHESPEDFLQHLRHLSGAIIMEIIYGIKVLPSGDPYLKLAEETFAAVAQATNPGSFLVDTLPILKHVPEWMPGAGFKKKARIWRKLVMAMPALPFMACKKALSEGAAIPSFTASLLDKLFQRTDADYDAKEEEAIIRNTGATAYGAGADTTTVALSWFVLAMVLYPEAQRKAQAELDEVLGSYRLPEFEDRKDLPYLNALCNEIQRWHPVFPLGISHGLMQDDVYEGQLLPKGSVIVGNAWAMLHNEEIYGPNTDRFEPERFLRPGVKDPNAAFGFGRRICPGRYLAENTIFIAVSSILTLFTISHAKDADGKDIPIDVSFTSGAIMRPDPFPCSITLRSASAASLLPHTYE
ncbi:cytochrome P450 [Ramaria rubella]|nr:cytochrome P450 [Ramaria rubella]